jgi:hypothetical protein
MLIDLIRRGMGDTLAFERIEASPVDFEGGAAEEGVLVNFALDGRAVTGRIIRVYDSADGTEQVIEVEPINENVHDRDSEETLAHLPPGDDTGTTI